MNKTLYSFFLLMSIIAIDTLWAQELLSKEKALEYVLEKNLGLRIARNINEIKKNNQSFLNSGYLPSLSASSEAIFFNTDTESTLDFGKRELSLTGLETSSQTIGLRLSYLIFNGFGRRYNYKKFKEEYKLSEIETQEIIASTIVQLFLVYYQASLLTEKVYNQRKILNISRDRLLRVSIDRTYGQKTRLDELNARVDMHKDSISLINVEQNLKNVKRDLNLIMGEEITKMYTLDTVVTFISKEHLIKAYEKAIENNYEVRKVKSGSRIKKLSYQASKSFILPKITFFGNYNWSKRDNGPINFLTKSKSRNLSYGANLSWNIFASGKGVTAIKNAKILSNNNLIRQDLVIEQSKRDIENGWDTYMNRVLVYKVQKMSVKTALDNFSRTQEKYKTGQITSIEFRQAQVNLSNAINEKNKSKYDLKQAELQLLFLSGKVLNVDMN